jgi:hypothetical protein
MVASLGVGLMPGVVRVLWWEVGYRIVWAACPVRCFSKIACCAVEVVLV